MKQVERWGLHWEGEFAFLHEQSRSLCLNEGLGSLPSPFVVARRDRERCPHDLIGQFEEPEVVVPKHALVRAMAPIPSTAVSWLPGEHRQLVEEMTRMSGLYQGVFAPWATRIRSLTPRLTTTNISPIVIVGYEARDLPSFVELLRVPRTRPIVFCGAIRPAGAVALPTRGLTRLRPEQPWRAIGLSILRDHIAEQCSDRTRSLTLAS